MGILLEIWENVNLLILYVRVIKMMENVQAVI
jgi:hypothetical protein